MPALPSAFRLPKPLQRLLPGRLRSVGVVSVVRLVGVIGAAGPLRTGLTLSALAPTLEAAERLTQLQGAIHAHFIDLVKRRRGEKLKGADADLFNGAFWVGEEARALGLVDGLGDVRSVMRERFGKDVALRLVEKSRSS